MNRENLLRARSHIVFILALAAAFALVMWIERHSEFKPRSSVPGAAASSTPIIEFSGNLPPIPSQRALDPQEREWAQVAWRYFVNNTDPVTGLVHSVDKYEATTLWDSASYLLALFAAERLELISSAQFDKRLKKALDSLGKLPLVDGILPNKSYSTATLEMVDYRGKPAPNGIGWSAIDIARLMVPLNVIAWNYPQHTKAALRVIARWKMQALARDGVLFGAHRDVEGKLALVQEGRLGYEQYASKALGLFGFDMVNALDYRTHLAYANIYGVVLPYDRRDASVSGAHNYVLSEPYVLDGLEFGWDRISREFAWRVLRAQEERFHRTGILTAVTEDHVDQAPYFVYNTVFTDGKPWHALTDQGEDVSRLRTLSVKAAFGWHALYRTGYTDRLMAAVDKLFDPERGWYAGRYEEGGRPNKAVTANTNAVVLESLAYIVSGRMIDYRQVGK